MTSLFTSKCSQDLENSIRNHSEERLEKIEELGNELIEYECMIECVTADVKSVTERWNQLQHQVKMLIACVWHVSLSFRK